MKRALLLGLVGVFALVIFLVLRAPARLIERFLGDALPISLSDSTGTIWSGQANLKARGLDLGRASWNFNPSGLLHGAVGARWRVAGADHSLQGTAEASIAETVVFFDGQVEAELINRLLSDYHIHLGGTFELDGVTLHFGEAVLPSTVAGTLQWGGGATRYRLGGEIEDITLPPMQAVLSMGEEGHPQAEAFTDSAPAALIRARIDPDGWLHIAVSRRFTALAGRPWPGTGDADEMVVEVAERL